MSDIKRDMAMERLDAVMDLESRQAEAIKMLIERLAHARREHPVFATDAEGAMDVIDDEFCELIQAVRDDEGTARIIDEALDVAATAMRLVMGEVKK